MATRSEYNEEVERREQADRAADAARITRVEGLLVQARENITSRLRNAGEFETLHLESLRAEVDDIMGGFDSQVRGIIDESATDITDAATRDMTDTLRIAQIEAIFPAIDRSLLSVYSDFTGSLIGGATTQARAQIMQEVALSAVGAKTRTDAIKAIGENLTDPSIFRTIESRSRTIFTTEMGRLRSAARQARMDVLSDRDLGLKKYWQDRDDGATRTTHRSAGRSYSPERAIDLEARYLVGGYPALYPRDWALPAKESVNCRCLSLVYVPDVFFT